MPKLEFEKGKTYHTHGGWQAIVVWICEGDLQKGFYTIHRPLSSKESVPIFHGPDGRAFCNFSVNEPPRYEQPHPADLVEEVGSGS